MTRGVRGDKGETNLNAASSYRPVHQQRTYSVPMQIRKQWHLISIYLLLKWKKRKKKKEVMRQKHKYRLGGNLLRGLEMSWSWMKDAGDALHLHIWLIFFQEFVELAFHVWHSLSKTWNAPYNICSDISCCKIRWETKGSRHQLGDTSAVTNCQLKLKWHWVFIFMPFSSFTGFFVLVETPLI